MIARIKMLPKVDLYVVKVIIVTVYKPVYVYHAINCVNNYEISSVCSLYNKE